MQSNLFEDEYLIVVSDNNSTDQTAEIVKNLNAQNYKISYLFVPQKGKGIAVLSAWKKYQADFDIFCFMDADLATDLSAFSPLINAIKGGADLAIGSRYLAESKLKRSFLRKIFSAGYRLVLKLFLGTKIKDFCCGFKAANQKVVRLIAPQVKNTEWFFDSEMLYLALKAGYKIKEVPVVWHEPRSGENKSRISLFRQSFEYLKEVITLRIIKR